MRAVEVRISELFKGNVMYVSPSFHRPYAWVDGVCERILNTLGGPTAEPLFMGALVTLDLGVKSAGFRKALLIDGNSRLLTVLILLMALRDAIRPLDPGVAGRMDDAFFINPIESPVPIFKNIVNRRDRPVFESLVLGEKTGERRDPVSEVYAFGKRAFASQDLSSLTELSRRLVQGFTFVELALERGEDPYPVFKLFNQQDNAFTRTGLDAYTQFSSDPELMSMIAGGESQEVEFKAHSILQSKEGHAVGVFSIVRAVAGFMNSRGGGTLLVGVEDDGHICGVEGEYREADKGKGNWDGYQLYLANMLRARLDSKNAFLHYSIEKHTARNHDVCMIRIMPGEQPAYIDKHFYVRTNNQTVEMLGPDLVDYVNSRFTES